MEIDKDSSKTKKRAKSKLSKKGDSPLFWRNVALALLAVVVITQFFSIKITPRFGSNSKSSQSQVDFSSKVRQGAQLAQVDISKLQAAVLPSEGVKLPIKWNSLGKRMIADGVIDEAKFRALFKSGLQNEEEQILAGNWDSEIIMTPQNSRFVIDMLWAVGLSNKNEILLEEMYDEKYGGDPSKFASTGGWTLSDGSAMDHYSKHPYLSLSSQQQDLVDKVSKSIYRPCCGNSAHFPDCNHGMAMLGLLEMMAANGISEDEMYKTALVANSFWFPQTYLDLATYFEEQGQSWDQIDAKLLLGPKYSSAQGYQSTRQQIKSLPKPPQGGGGCGV